MALHESRTKEAVDEQSGPGGSGALEVERRRPLAAIIGKPSYNPANNLAVRRAFESAGVEFIDENGGGPGVRLRKRQRVKQPK